MIEPRQAVDEAFLTSGTWEIEIAGRRYPAAVSARPLYDPKAERIKR
jgi:4-methylaminobutanoate oxidase (formaldehyde-forming)